MGKISPFLLLGNGKKIILSTIFSLKNQTNQYSMGGPSMTNYNKEVLIDYKINMRHPFDILNTSPIKIYSTTKEDVKLLLSGDNTLYLLLTVTP